MILRANRILFVKNKENVAFNQPLVHETKSSQYNKQFKLCMFKFLKNADSVRISASFNDH